jgi:hypothetical protein
MLYFLTLLPVSYHLLGYIVDGSVQRKYINHIKRHNFTQIGAILCFSENIDVFYFVLHCVLLVFYIGLY